jgi:hypothetical protein
MVEEDDQLSASLHDDIRLAEALSAKLLSRAYYSPYHLWSARHFGSRASEIEAHEIGTPPAFNIEHRAYVTAAIMSAVAFLEAAINEVFQDAADAHHSYVGTLDQHVLDRLQVYWEATENGKKPTLLQKYAAALRHARAEHIATSAATHQNATLLVTVRNLLVHFRPESSGPDEPQKLLKQLKSKNISVNPFSGAGSAFFPEKCLSAAFAQWSVDVSVAYADEFFRKLNVTPNYQRVQFK